MSFYQEFSETKEKIIPNYQRFVALINQVVQLVDELFVLQTESDRAVYSKDFSDEDKKKLGDTGRYTVIQKKGKTFEEIPYHAVYSIEIEKIVKVLTSAIEEADVIAAKEFDKQWWKKYLTLLIAGFKEDKWDDVEAFFLSIPKSSPFLLSIGPIERYHDKVFGTKRFYSAWFLYKNIQEQHFYQPLWDKFEEFNKQMKLPFPVTSINIVDCKLYIGDTISKGGEVAKLKATGWSRPERGNIAKQFGSIKIISLNEYIEKTKKTDQEVTYYLSKWKFTDKRNKSLLKFIREYSLLSHLLHEYGHTFLKADNASATLNQFYTFTEEPRADINMLYIAQELEKKGDLPKDTTVNIFLFKLTQFNYMRREYLKYNQRLEYFLATTFWIYTSVNKELINIQNGSIVLNNKNLEQNLAMMIEDIFIFLNTCANFGSSSHENYALFKQSLIDYSNEIAVKLHLR